MRLLFPFNKTFAGVTLSRRLLVGGNFTVRGAALWFGTNPVAQVTNIDGRWSARLVGRQVR